MPKYFLILTCLISLSAFAASETKEFESKGLKNLIIENRSGKISIGGMITGPKAYVKITKNKFSDKCKMTMERIDDNLTLKVEKSSSVISTEDCDVDLQVTVPEAINLDLSNGSGNMMINRIRSDILAFKIGSGDITVTDAIIKKIDGKSGNGIINIFGLAGGGEIKSGSGHISLAYEPGDLKGELEIKIGSGDADILFPKSSKIKTSFKAGSGELKNILGDTPDAPFKVSMKAGSGNLLIRAH